MAGDWIKIEHTLPGKPEVDTLAVTLGIDHDAVIGKLVRLWVWADQQMIDCNGARVTDSFLDRLTNCPGFALALVDVGWLTSRNGRLSLPNFDRHNGQTAKSRALTASRVKRSRNGDGVTQSLPEKRREEKKVTTNVVTTPSSPQSEVPEELRTPEFLKAWADWLDYRRSKRKAVSPAASKQQLANLVKFGPAVAVEAIKASIRSDWQGLFPEKIGAADSTGRRPRSTEPLDMSAVFALEKQRTEGG